jgi:SAM-dependent methyltransferase
VYTPTLKEIGIRVSNRLAGGLPIPRPRYITNVAGAPDVGHYLASGKDSLRAIQELLERSGVDAAAPGRVLDFGCGSGRILRHWHRAEGLELHGTDYNPHLIAWCTRNYPFARFRVNELEGPLPYPDESFDFAYAWSVFTHLPETLEEHHVAELARVLRPGGHLLATFHGEFYAQSMLSPGERERFAAGELIVHGGEKAGSNACASFHAPLAVRRKFGASFEVRDFRAGTAPLREQDRYLFRKA